ncbi:Glycosyl transferase family 28 C-terminal [Arabidopsis thaliana x Arabidopsis arenosa]|uniref:Glycosyl transferase family 28 C-terminal n=2 Tax=Arabidopsis thaliana x Arabidopsis arenosa TaxID=1240361 RepID=A0A8T2BJC3_9BRAS|nr:Glycosyl transferase family 28 C-terminal [Arabidopsis thaliana x Arabidopsis arenosa]
MAIPSFLSPNLPFCPSTKLIPSRLTISSSSSSSICCISVDRQINHSSVSDEISGLRVVISAGGTAGHISSALAIGDELKSADPLARILFIGFPNSMESTTVPSAGFEFSAISTVGSSSFRPFLCFTSFLKFPLRLIQSTFESYKILRKFKPQIVVGTGGHASFPVCFAAVISRTKLVIQEQDSIPGTTNWILSFFADTIFAPFNCTVTNLPKRVAGKCVVYGNPIRQALRRYSSKGAARVSFFGQWAGAVSEAKVVLLLGGSLGANAINIALLNCYSQLLSEHENWFFVWQTGVEAFDEMDSLVRSHPRLFLSPFLRSIGVAYAAADLVISRAGAMTCSEIMALGKPSILIPSPHSDEGDQVRNASLMADIVGSKLITEEELDTITLRAAMEDILGNEELMMEMSERAFKAAKPDAASDVAKHIISIIKSKDK